MIKVALIPNDFYVADKGFEEVIALCAEENVHHIEIAYLWGKSILDLGETEVAKLHDILDVHGISIASIQTQIMKVFPRGAKLAKAGSKHMNRDPDYNVSRIDSAIQMAGEFGARHIVTYSYFTYLNKRPEESLWTDLFADYDVLVQKCKAAGKTMVVECEGDTLVRDTSTYLKLFEHYGYSPHLKANLDLANFVGHVDDFTRDDFDRLHAHVEYFHVKDRTPSKSLLRKLPVIGKNFKATSAVLGEGTIPWRRVLPWFIETGFDGTLSVEPHVHGKEKFEDARRCVQNLKALLVELGIKFD